MMQNRPANLEFQVFDCTKTSEDMQTDVKYQDIIYYKWDRKEAISSDHEKRIDYQKAASEMEKLDWSFVHNHIGFVNKRKAITIQFVRLGENKWYAENIIMQQGRWTGCVWHCNADNKTITHMTRLFFEEDPKWFDSLSWKFKRVQA